MRIQLPSSVISHSGFHAEFTFITPHHTIPYHTIPHVTYDNASLHLTNDYFSQWEATYQKDGIWEHSRSSTTSFPEWDVEADETLEPQSWWGMALAGWLAQPPRYTQSSMLISSGLTYSKPSNSLWSMFWMARLQHVHVVVVIINTNFISLNLLKL